jgi:ketosteroid isomerase-like protein
VDRKQLAREVYEAFAAGDREAIERLLGDDFEFHAPPDPELGRAEVYFGWELS